MKYIPTFESFVNESNINEKLEPNQLRDILTTFIEMAGKLTKVDLSRIAKQQPKDLDDCIRLVLNELPKEVKNKFVNQAEKYIEAKKIKESTNEGTNSDDAYALNRLADMQIGSAPAAEFLAKHNIDLAALSKAKMAGVINQYEIRDVVNGKAHKSLEKQFLKDYVKESTEVNEGAVKAFEMDYADLVKNIKSGYGWIDPAFVEQTWNNTGNSIDFSLVKDEVLNRLIKADLLYFADDKDEEKKGKKVTNISQVK